MPDNGFEAIQTLIQKATEFLKAHHIQADDKTAALRWIDNYINEGRSAFSDTEKHHLTEIFGAFLGDCICCAYQGRWIQNGCDWFIELCHQCFVFGESPQMDEKSIYLR